MADTIITYTIPEAKVHRVIDAMKGFFPIPKDSQGDPLFTDNQWAKEAVRRWIRDIVARYEQKTQMEAVSYSPDDTIIA